MDSFSLENFKKWMSQQKSLDKPIRNGLIGLKVESKIAAKRIAKHVISCDGDLKEICEDFKKNGGLILETEDVNFLIEVDSGTFKVHRCFVRKKQND
jgi:hypothetical protein